MTDDSRNAVLQLTGGTGIGDPVRGRALVSRQGFGVRYDLDPERGVIANPDHDLYGQSIVGQILIFTEPKGGVAASWSLADLSDRGLSPLAIVFRRVSPIFVQGALYAGLAVLHNLDQDPDSVILTGDELAVFPTEGRIEVFR